MAELPGDREQSKKKTFIVDTNVLIHDHEAIEGFTDNDIVIPLVVIEELDHLKLGVGEVPYSARKALKLIDKYRMKGGIDKGVALPGGGKLRVETYSTNYFHDDKPDNIIVSCAMHLQKDQKLENVVVVSKDTAVRIKAESQGVKAEDYRRNKTSLFQKYGRILTSDDYTNGIKSVRYKEAGDSVNRIWGEDLNQLIRKRDVHGISPKNTEQACAIDALTNPAISIVALTGKAGAGKTLLALASALQQTLKRDPLFNQVMVARPTVPMGGYDLGFLPGNVGEKINPWMMPIFDNLEICVKTPKDCHDKDGDKDKGGEYKSYQYLIDNGVVAIEPLSYIRGRSLPGRYIIVDEAQNLRPHDVKTIVTRLGEGSKIVFTGDMNQIDTPYLDAESNGLAHLIARLINEEDFCYLNLQTSARSSLANRMAELL